MITGFYPGVLGASYLGKVDDKAIYDDFLTAECFRVEICSCSECISPKTLPCNSKYYIASSGDRLIDAAISGDANLVERLLCSGANVNYNKTNFKNPGGATPLHFAASRNHSSVAVVLLKNGANVNATDNTGETPLAWAAGEDADDVINVLIESGARLTLHTAAQLGRFSDLRKLIERSGDINAKDRKAWTPLHHAADKCRVKVASFLIKEGALVKAETKHGYTPLHLAAASGCPEIAQFLIQGGASVNAKTDNLAPFVSAYSPLHSAVIHCETKYEKPKVPGGDVVVVKLLIEANADVNTKDSGGSTPLDDASTRKCRTIERLLLEHGARH